MAKNNNTEENQAKKSIKNVKKDVILMGAPEKEKEIPKETLSKKTEPKSVRIEFDDKMGHTTATKEELSKVTKQPNSLIEEKGHVGLGKVFLGLIVLFVAYLIVGQILNFFGPTTISFFGLWPLLLILVGLSLFRVKKKGVTALLVYILIFIFFAAAAGLVFKRGDIVTINTAGVVATEERGIDPFSGIVFDGRGSVKVTEGDREAVIVKGDEAVLGEVETTIEEDVLYINYSNALWDLFLFEETAVDIEVIARDISSVKMEGIGDITISDIDAEKLELSITGKGSLAVQNISAEELIVRVLSTSSVVAKGVAEREFIFIEGAGSYDGSALISSETGVRIVGTGSAEVYTNDTLDAEIRGGGSLIYSGNPTITEGSIGSIMSVLEGGPSEE